MSRPITPLIAVDTIIELINETHCPIVLIERRYPPHGWALPGGFVDVGESLERAAIREAQEETSLDIQLKSLLGCYSDPARDHRGHTVSVIYIAQSEGVPIAADDAINLAIYPLDDLPKQLVFDHDKVLQDYLRFKETGKIPAPELYNHRKQTRTTY